MTVSSLSALTTTKCITCEMLMNEVFGEENLCGKHQYGLKKSRRRAIQDDTDFSDGITITW